MKFGSVCSGIEAATVAWDSLGWEAAWLSEIEPFPCAVLAHHYGDTPNLGDMTKIRDRIKDKEVIAPDVLVGGTPCQAFSVAGARKSLDDDRGQLTLEYVRLLNEIDAIRLIRGEQPVIAVWENVPGVLNTKDNAFGCFLGALAGEDCELQPAGKKWTNAGCVFGPQRAVAWRVLDAQYFGVAQRRRRVFVVASARKGFNPAKVLLESDGVRRDIAPSRETGQDVTKSTGSSVKNPSGYRMTAFGQYADDETASTMKRRDYKDATDLVVAAQCFQQNTRDEDNGGNQGQENVIALAGNTIGRQPHNGGNGNGFDASGVCYTLTATDRHGVAITIASKQQAMTCEDNLASTLGANDYKEPQAVLSGKVRRLTPVECERLQGFPDSYTKIPYRNKKADDCPDGPRYAALGNSMAVPVMRWIGERIQKHIDGAI